MKFDWGRQPHSFSEGYEVSTKGDKRFSALVAKVDGKTIEYHYQVNIKSYSSIKEGKGKPPLNCTPMEAWLAYKKLWDKYLTPELEADLRVKAAGCMLTDIFANGPVSQARALAELLNERSEARKIKENRMKYAGVGSRSLTQEENPVIYAALKSIGYSLAKHGHVLMACGAKGADDAFLQGALEAINCVEFNLTIEESVDFFLPWDNCNGIKAKAKVPTQRTIDRTIIVWNERAATSTRPTWDKLKATNKPLFVRSAMAVENSDFVVTWATNEKQGGTGFTLDFAKRLKKPIFNIYNGQEALIKFIKEAK